MQAPPWLSPPPFGPWWAVSLRLSIRDIVLDYCPHFGYIFVHLAHRGRLSGKAGLKSEARAVAPSFYSDPHVQFLSQLLDEISECGRICHPLPGGSGPPLGRHDDRSPRSAVDSRQIEAGNARKLLLAYDLSENRYPLFRIIRSIGSQETRELELSQRRMRSPWRVPQQSAGRRARPARARCRPERRREWRNLRALVCMAAMVGMRLSARCSLFHCRERIYFCVVVERKTRV